MSNLSNMLITELIKLETNRVDCLLFAYVVGSKTANPNLSISDCIRAFQVEFCIDEDEDSITALRLRFFRIAKKANKTLRRKINIENEEYNLVQEIRPLINELKRIVKID